MRGLKFALILAVSGCAGKSTSGGQDDVSAAAEVKGLKTAASFESISDDQQRAVALFTEAGKVMLHARCINCHPSSDRPLQTDSGHPHNPMVVRGEKGFGAVGMRCQTCHQTGNVELGDRSIPGHPIWHLAPRSMAWEGQSLGQICDQIKDPERNGGHNLDEIAHHMGKDSLVGWAWTPGTGRSPVPGTQAVFGELIDAWVSAGAHCPTN